MSGGADPGEDLSKVDPSERYLYEQSTEEIVERVMSKKDPVYWIGLEDSLTSDEDALAMMHPREIMTEIDICVKIVGQYIAKRRKKLSRVKWAEMWVDVEIEFGTWSGKLNRIVREKLLETGKEMGELKGDALKTNKELHNMYSWLNAYWWNRMHWIQTVFKSQSGLGGISTKRGMMQGADTLKKLIEGKADWNQIHDNFKTVIRNLKMTAISPEVKNTLDKMG